MSLQNEAEKYFSKLNPIARRLHVDLNTTKAAYDKLWSTLTENEQNQILTESIIKPEVCLKYNVTHLNTENKNNYALKVISDDNFSYRDEHSAPFSFRTPSQRDLRLFEDGNENQNIVSKPALLAQSETCDRNTPSSSSSSSLFNLPKTGLDLLDNW
ncbi:hypothetical protein RI129_004457 [Pyrocoelia pectoralis]|uniref:DUF4706 domain-containing protein n=1 Tax=Pyrocoelia pectoralis TaxID=417401 RepID=A0AAN7VIY8_9COLE